MALVLECNLLDLRLVRSESREDNGSYDFCCSAMNHFQFRTRVSLGTAALITILLLGTQCRVVSQSGGLPNTNSSVSADKNFPGDNQANDSLSEEIRAKRAIKEAEKQYKQHLDRAKELSDLGKQLDGSFQRKNSLDDEDNKKLERLEKLTKRIRDEAGGSDGETTIENLPTNLGGAVRQVAKVSESLSQKIQKTPRQVVSAAMIADANALLELIRVVRHFSRQG